MRIATQLELQRFVFQNMARTLRTTNVTLRSFIHKYLPHYFTAAPSSFHEDSIDHLQKSTFTRNVKSAVAGPRGSAKSTIYALAAPLWWTCEGLEQYQVLGADTFSQASQHLMHIQEELTSNERIEADYPHVFGKGSVIWSRESLITRNNIRIDALGAGKKVRGRRHGKHRPTVIVIDDPENDEGARSPIVRDRVRQWLDAGVLKAGQPGTNFFVNGTLINGSCLMASLLDRPGWEHRCYQSIVTWPKNMDLWDEWEKIYFDDCQRARDFFEAHQAAMEEGAVVLWPQREPLYDLMVMRAEGGHSAFMAEKQNRPMNPSQCRFDEMWFTDAYDIWHDKVPAGAYSFLAVDPSTGNDAKKGDYIALIEGYWKPGERRVWIDGTIDRFPAAEIVPRCLNLHARKNFVFCAFESNAFQVTMAEQLQEESVKRGIFLPVLEINHMTQKIPRIERLGPFLSKGVFSFAKQNRQMKRMVEQLCNFPVGDHDDGPDALEMLVTCINEWVNHYYARNNENVSSILEVAA